MKVLLLSVLFPATVVAHGFMTYPPSRHNSTLEMGGSCLFPGQPLFPLPPYNVTRPDGTEGHPWNAGTCLWFNQGCTIGCEKCGGSDGKASCPGKQGKATLPQAARTYQVNSQDCGITPWCAPGSAPLMDPCGVAGGDVNPGKPGNGGYPPTGFKYGRKGTDLPPGPTTTWQVGSTQEVGWAITANHGGGYQYRLCPKSSPQTESCFQKTPLAFVGSTHEIRYINESHKRQTIPAMYVTDGVMPKGSMWARNPIPACGLGGGAFDAPCFNYQFKAAGNDLARPGKPLGGFGGGSCLSGIKGRECTQKQWESHLFQWNIFDKVTVPANLAAGDYTLSFRWESEQTPQIWSQCSEIKIVAQGILV